MRKSVLIRVDGARHLGMGHVVRCLNFADTLRTRGIESIFVTRDFAENVIERIKSAGFKLHTFNKDNSFEEDATITAQLAKDSGALCIITDLSNEENLAKREEFLGYCKLLKSAGKFLIAFDDLNKIDFPFDIQIVPYYGAEDIDYRRFQETKYLLGCSYCIAAPNLVKKVRIPREINETGRKVLVAIGGTDPDDLTLDVARALANLDIPGLEAKFILGTCFDENAKAQTSNLLKDFKGFYEFCSYSNNVPELMMWSDLAITGIGLTRYEAALTGTPNVCLARQDMKIFSNDKFIKAGTSSHLTVPDPTCFNRIVKEVGGLLKSPDARKKMHKIGRSLIDGGGAERIITELEKRILK